MNILELSKKLESLAMDESVRREISDLFACFENRRSFKDSRLFVFFAKLALSNSYEEYSKVLDELKQYLLGNVHKHNIPEEISATEQLISYLQDEILYRKQEYRPSLSPTSQDKSSLLETTENNK